MFKYMYDKYITNYIYTKNVNWNETRLCVVIIGCAKKLLWKSQGRPCWIQRENNDVNVYATSKSSLSVKKRIFPFNRYVLNFPGV
jgi:hypothetical protein